MLSVMVVDDEPRAIDFVCSLIGWEENGFHLAAVAGSAKQAFAILSSTHIDIVLFDVMMPDVTGVELSRLIHSSYPDVEMAALSSYDDYDYVREVLLNGASDYVLKHRLDGKILLTLLEHLKKNIEEKGRKEPFPLSEQSRLRELVLKGFEGKAEEVLLTIIDGRWNGEQKMVFASSFISFLLSFEGIGIESYVLQNAERIYMGLAEGDSSHALEALSMLSNLSEQRQHPRSRIVLSAIRLMENSYAMNLTLDDAAGVVGANPAYLSRLFHSETGLTFVDYLTEIRLGKAFLLIKEGRNLKSVAYETGFKDYGYFLKVFKKKTGLTPAEYMTLLENTRGLLSARV